MVSAGTMLEGQIAGLGQAWLKFLFWPLLKPMVCLRHERERTAKSSA